MVKRQFKLQSVLDVKERLEEKLQQQLAFLQGIHQALQLELFEMLIEESERISEMRDGMVGGGLDVNTIAIKLAYLDQLGAEIQRQNAIVNDMLYEIEQQREKLVVAVQEKKALEKLKEKNEERVLLEEKREESKFVDDISMSRFNRQSVSQTPS